MPTLFRQSTNRSSATSRAVLCRKRAERESGGRGKERGAQRQREKVGGGEREREPEREGDRQGRKEGGRSEGGGREGGISNIHKIVYEWK